MSKQDNIMNEDDFNLDIEIANDVPLKHLHTFGLDVKAKNFISYSSVEELQHILKKIAKIKEETHQNIRILHIGEGSNLLFTKDFNGIILHSNIKHISYHHLANNTKQIEVSVGAGVNWDSLCEELAKKEIYGTENLSYIPGEVGAAAVQNIGAYGVEVSDIIKQVKTIEIETGRMRIFENHECEYDYRKSIFKSKYKGKYIVIEVTFSLSIIPVFHLDYGALKSLKLITNSKGVLATPNTLNAMSVRNKVIEIRKSKLPEINEYGSAGSFFMNPIISKAEFTSLQKNHPEMPYYELDKGQKYKIPAAWLIEQCGWKGKTYGGAQVYQKHPLILINKGQAKPSDIVTLAEQIQKSVFEKFDIRIQPEVLYI